LFEEEVYKQNVLDIKSIEKREDQYPLECKDGKDDDCKE